MRPWRYRLVLVLALAAAAWAVWTAFLDRVMPSADGSSQIITESARQDRVLVGRRVRSARLRVDSMHRQNTQALARRNRTRRGPPADDVPATDTFPEAHSAESTAVYCARLLRVDDRLVRSLSAEIDGARDLLDEYERLSTAYEREVAACSAVLQDCRRNRRRRKRRNRTFVAAVALVAVVLLLD